MEEKIFCTEKLDFKDRIKKGLLFKILAFFIFFSMILLSVKGNDAGIFELIFALYLLTVTVVIILRE
ncbi:hypothetical protein NAT51_02855 [Flavobacterium amniphilum]|uniref:hypothetical protein n=1 Tax=Flavobacterium amniphilum TaxID=1834035 RepID=UPI00202A2092|nr:hypothetical protein [Flavobacterium amniphilum]MCL9804444.1 hypothetical protein [Flavobacterium amniphilum]